MKKGVTHIDWVISIFIFLIYIVILFTFIRPVGYEPTKEGLILTSIVEDNLKAEISTNFTKAPLFVDAPSSGNEVCLSILPYDWQLLNMNFIDAKLNNVAFELNPDSVTCPNTKLSFNYNNFLVTGKNVFYLLFNGEGILNKDTWTCTASCDNTVGYIYGVPEVIKGISLTKFSNLANYNTLKSNWNYPSNKEFKISIFNLEDRSLNMSLGSNELVNENVYVKEFIDFVISQDGTKQAKLVNIKTW